MIAPLPDACFQVHDEMVADYSSRLRRKHKTELESLADDDARAARVAELNVQQSIEVLKQHPAINKAIHDRGLTLHGMIYDIGEGQLRLLEDTSTVGKKNYGLWAPS